MPRVLAIPSPVSCPLCTGQGAGMADGALPLGEVRAALCVPRSCAPAALQAALQEGLRRQHPGVAVEVRPEYCHLPEDRPAPSTASWLFW